MGQLLNIAGQLHRRTARDYVGRMTDDKVGCMKVARRFDRDYWDGDRRFGYGGYRYDGRWATVAKLLADHYRLPPDAKILDIGCGKAFLLYEFTNLLPAARVIGFDISAHAIETAKDEVRPGLFVRGAEEVPYPFADGEFDLVISLMTLHNLPIQQLVPALREMNRVGKQKYLTVESYRDEDELFNLQCWALTCETYLRPESWSWVFEQAGYTGDHEFLYFEPAPAALARPA